MPPQPHANPPGAEVARHGVRPAATNAGVVHGAGISALNQLLADTIMLRDLYKKHQWQVTGGDFYPLHLLFEKHCAEQSTLVDMIAERVAALGGTQVVMPHDVTEITRIARPRTGRESVPSKLARLLDAHEAILTLSHEAADIAGLKNDDVTHNLIAGNVVRLNELQVWFLLEHLDGSPVFPHRT
ncbi:MAG: polymerase [Rhodospirillales bacterium]|nr:polymerase [Rhodospirillales bacterium]